MEGVELKISGIWNKLSIKNNCSHTISQKYLMNMKLRCIDKYIQKIHLSNCHSTSKAVYLNQNVNPIKIYETFPQNMQFMASIVKVILLNNNVTKI